jgi:hypothetical protein
MARIGAIKDTFPPGNNGSSHGAGRVTDDETGNDFVFQTPDDVAPGLALYPGLKVAFNISGNQATGLVNATEQGTR